MSLVYIGLVTMAFLDLIRLEALLGLATLPLGALGIVTALRHYDESSKLAPANWSTIVNQLFTGLFLTLGYILHGMGIDILITGVIGVVLFIIVTLMAQKLGRPPPGE